MHTCVMRVLCVRVSERASVSVSACLHISLYPALVCVCLVPSVYVCMYVCMCLSLYVCHSVADENIEDVFCN